MSIPSSSSRKRAAAFAAASFAVFGALIFACDVADEEAGTPKKPSTSDATVSSDGQSASDAPTKVTGLCGKVGGPTAVATMSNAIYDRVAADCRIGIYFTSLGGRAAHVKECMAKQLQESFDCPVVYAGSKASDGKECRTLNEAHQDIRGADGKSRLNDVDFNAYVQSVGAALLEAKLSDSEVQSVTSVFIGHRNTVAPTVGAQFNSYCSCSGGTFEAKACMPEGGYIIPGDANVPDVQPDTNVPVDANVPDTADAASE